MSIKIMFATINDIDDIMKFIDNNWKKNHILSINKDLFQYEFLDTKNSLNFAIAKNENENEIVGIFGFLKYSNSTNPDISGSIWKVNEEKSSEPFLGIKLRNFVIKNIPHRLFIGTGAGEDTRNIYKILKMEWDYLNHFFILNPNIKDFQIASVKEYTARYIIPPKNNDKYLIKQVFKDDQIKSFPFDKFKGYTPFKDHDYLKKRFLEYPFYKYDIFTLEKDKEILNIFICRKIKYKSSSIYRIVDFYGEEEYLSFCMHFLFERMIQNNYEYIDFLCYGFNKKKLQEIGFSEIDFNSENIIIPNYFEPFIKKNIKIFFAADKTDIKYRICKADGDQDRPNKEIKNEL